MGTFIIDKEVLKTGLIIFRRGDVKHENWYCRIQVDPKNRDKKVSAIAKAAEVRQVKAPKYKTIALHTPILREARDIAFDLDAEVRFGQKHSVPIFAKTFAEVALEYSAQLKADAAAGELSMGRWERVDSSIRNWITPYVGETTPVTDVNEDIWKGYKLWRKHRRKRKAIGPRMLKRMRKGKAENEDKEKDQAKVDAPTADGTIRHELIIFKAILVFAAKKEYVRLANVPDAKVAQDKARRDHPCMFSSPSLTE